MSIKKQSVNKNFVEDITHNECKDDVLFHQICMTHSMNKIQNKNHRLRSYEINKNFFVLV